MVFKLVGHPDFQAVNSTPVTVLAAQFFALNPGTWGPSAVPTSSGGSYLMTLYGVTGGNAGFADIKIDHLDSAGNLIHSDQFSAVPVGGSSIPSNSVMPQTTIIRGNIYGASLRISGVTAASAWIAGVFGGSTVASGFNINVYVLPGSLTDPEPRMFCGLSASVFFSNFAPGNLLWTAIGRTVPFGTNSGVEFIYPYSGPCDFSYYQQGVITTPTNLRFNMFGWTVANGPTAILHKEFVTSAAVLGQQATLSLPTMLMTMTINNNDGAQNATVNANLTASASA